MSDNTNPNNTKKGGCLTVIIAVIAIGAIAGYINKGDKSTSETSNDNSVSTTTTQSAITAEKVKDEYPITVVSTTISEDYAGKPVLVVEYEWTNNSNKATSFSLTYKDQVFQNGIECSNIVIGCDLVDTDKQLNDIEPGITYKVKVGYILQDTTSDVKIKCTGLFLKKANLEQTVKL